MDDMKTIKKNKIDLKHQTILQERNAILLALIGVPLTVVNLLVSVLKIDLADSLAAAFVLGIFLWNKKLDYDKKIQNNIINELDGLLNKKKKSK